MKPEPVRLSQITIGELLAHLLALGRLVERIERLEPALKPQPPTIEPHLRSVKTAADRIGVSTSWLYRAFALGCPSTKIGSMTKVNVPKVLAWIEKHGGEVREDGAAPPSERDQPQ